jgi:hypothetical protein
MSFKPIGKTGNANMILRGDLFSCVSLSEWLILYTMYGALVKGELEPTDDCAAMFNNAPFERPADMSVRPAFIKSIQTIIMRVQNCAIADVNNDH